MRAKKLFSLILTLCLAFTTIGSLGIVNAEDVTITETINLEKGEAYTLPATLADSAGTKVAVTWSPATVDTSKIGYKLYTGTLADNTTVTYRVNVGEWITVKGETFESLAIDAGATAATKVDNLSSDGFSIITSTDNSVKVAYENGESGNKVLSMPGEMNWNSNSANFTGFSLANEYNESFSLEGKIKFKTHAANSSVYIVVTDSLTNYGVSNSLGGVWFAQTGTATSPRVKNLVGNITNSSSYPQIKEKNFSYTIDGWADFKVVFNYSNRTYDIYVNNMDTPLMSDIPYTVTSDGDCGLKGITFVTRDALCEKQFDDLYLKKFVYPTTVADTTDTVAVGDATAQTTTVSLPMSDGTTKDFTVNYTADTESNGTGKIAEGTIEGFSEKVTVTYDVLGVEEKAINTYVGAELTLEDGTEVDTSVIGRKCYQINVDGSLIKYTVNIGEFTEKVKDNMSGHSNDTADEGEFSTISPNENADGLKLTITNNSSYPNSAVVAGDSNDQYISVGGTTYTASANAKWNVIDYFNGDFKVSARMKLENVDPTVTMPDGSDANTDPDPTVPNYANNFMVFSSNGYLLGVSGLYVRASSVGMRGATSNLQNIGYSSSLADVVITSDIGYALDESTQKYNSNWFKMDMIFYGDTRTYDILVNDKVVHKDIPFLNTNADGNIGYVSLDKRSTLSGTFLMDDLTVYQFNCFTGNLDEAIDIAVPVGSTKANLPLVLSNGSSKDFDVTVECDTSKIANLSNVDATIAGFDGTVKANVKVCNYDVEGVNLKNGSEFVTAPVAGGEIVSIVMKKLTNANAQTAIVALYGADDTIKAIKTADLGGITFGTDDAGNPEKTVVDVNMTLPENTATGDYVRVYVWDSKANIQPLDMVTELTFEYGVAPAVYFAGDSTMCSYSYAGTSSQWPKAGVGQVFSNFYNGNVTNVAVSGATTQTFIDNGLWGRIISNVKTGDYVIISFGHNDQDYCLTTPCFFKTNLQTFIDEARTEGANVIMYSPISRRGQEDNDNRFEPGGDHKTHMADLEAICTANNVPFIDMEEKSVTYLENLTDTESAHLYMIDLVDNMSQYKDKTLMANSIYNPDLETKQNTGFKTDNTHFTLYGAKVYAQMLVNAISEQYPDIQLTNYLKNLSTTITYPALD